MENIIHIQIDSVLFTIGLLINTILLTVLITQK